MNEMIGKVLEVYIPLQYKDNNLLDIMDRDIIGFKVMTNNGIKEIIVKQDDENANILKDSIVKIIKKNISGKSVMDIELYGEYNE